MGEANRRRKAMEEGTISKVLETCPVCKKEFTVDSGEKMLVTQYMVAMGQHGNQIQMAPSLPKVACTNCGVEFFGTKALEELRKKAKGERSNIITLGPGARVN